LIAPLVCAALALATITPSIACPLPERLHHLSDDLPFAITSTAKRLGISPLDLATVISYETAGTFDPWKRGPVTQHGQHRGLIQMGEPQRRKYGVTRDMPVADQLAAVGDYLEDAGVRPGMGLKDVYSAVNAGRVGRYSASDANNGGAPGTVADKVRYQMAGHKKKAQALLGGLIDNNNQVADAGDGTADSPPSARRQNGSEPAGAADDSLEAMIASFSEPTRDPRRLAIRETAIPLLADLLPEGQGQAVALGDDAGEQAGPELLSSLLGTQPGPATNPAGRLV
jgi:hypothetical protein